MGVLVVLAGLVVGALVVEVEAVRRGLVCKGNAVDTAWTLISEQLERRYDLIPDLIEIADVIARHERDKFDTIAAARVAAVTAAGPTEQAYAQNMLSRALRGMFGAAEAYPQLQSNRTFARLHNELSDTENRIAHARQRYNDAVLTFNNTVQSVPSNLVAGGFGFGVREFFTAPEPDRGRVAARL